MVGYIKLHRKIKEWEWYDDANTFRLFIHCLIEANHKDKEWRGIQIKRGQFHTSIGSLSTQLKLSDKAIRLALNKLIKTKEVATKGASSGASRGARRGTMITICNYDSYQGFDEAEGQAEGQAEWQAEGQTKGQAEGQTKGKSKGKKRATTNNDNNDLIIKEEKEYKNIPLSEIKFSDDSHFKKIHFDIAVGFQNLIRKNLTDLGAKTNNIDQTKGAAIDTIRLIMESDGYTEQDCRSVYKFLQQDPFWKKNILSIKTLREKFSKLIIQANGEQQNGAVQTANSANRKNTGRITAEDKKRSVERLGDMAETILQNLAPYNIQ